MTSQNLLRPAARPVRQLNELFEDSGDDAVELPEQSVEVSGITLDSRTVAHGDLYVALSGTRAHGAQFAPGAVGRGAVAILTDEAGRQQAGATGVPVVVAVDARDAMADAAATLFGSPTHQLMMFGLTGTNGKTTTTFLLEAALVAAGRRVGTIGTNGFRLDGVELPSNRTTVTTPESPDLQALLAVMLERGADSVAMEVSSHALALQRVDHIGFDVAGFTNLGRDHLDFHPTIEDYFEAKARLFEAEHCRVAVINTDDEHGRILAERITTAGAPRLVTTGFGDSDHQLLEVTPEGPGSRVRYRGPVGEREFTIDLPGDYNARNAVMALAMAVEAGLDADAALEGIKHAQVPGRMQLVRLATAERVEAPTVYVDFAHTPQAIEQAVRSARPGPGGRTIVVVGAGGDRDAAKRGPMGQAAAAGTGMVVVTDDNPRTEDPALIRAAVVEGARAAGGAEVVEQAGRRAGIGAALAAAGPADVVLVLGKGHEKGQTVGETVHDFDDVEVVLEEWEKIHEEN
ncbi:UDP-N-acetylmuramoylalanyl-D-glutamate--2,6-diaminopimelate ligase [Luteococcus japonicus]|uniref:UDP-N-acetylmuramoyl-L-alanyl-D-glutamate--2,6-diaminopimelate ligase n=1 Tax=Luteococcus japonicus TaxID=33984 RepID=A0A3N1ZZL6_9ACTN|nr:UDP-N-acetylmuramoyl-L-alanyl-D-glutamate--2,6-diaminopimelate ligase [Luteococcus japonicus]ROR55602.1 UDP-N-acetylmuramoylalanyl-D-glutamate--2,6-diaminopimelate ligase [Luteococcus japonicus]